MCVSMGVFWEQVQFPELGPWEWAQVPALLGNCSRPLFGMGSPVPLLAMNNLVPVKWFISRWARAGREMRGQEVIFHSC